MEPSLSCDDPPSNVEAEPAGAATGFIFASGGWSGVIATATCVPPVLTGEPERWVRPAMTERSKAASDGAPPTYACLPSGVIATDRAPASTGLASSGAV